MAHFVSRGEKLSQMLIPSQIRKDLREQKPKDGAGQSSWGGWGGRVWGAHSRPCFPEDAKLENSGFLLSLMYPGTNSPPLAV